MLSKQKTAKCGFFSHVGGPLTPPVWEFSPDLPSFLVFWSPASLPVRSPFPDQQRRRSQSCSSNTGVLTLFQHWCASVLLPTAGAAVLFQYRIHNTTLLFNSSAQHEGMNSNHLFCFIKSLHNVQYFKLNLNTTHKMFRCSNIVDGTLYFAFQHPNNAL